MIEPASHQRSRNSKKVKGGRLQRLIGWNVDVLKKQLRLILAMRDPKKIPSAIATIHNASAPSSGDSSGGLVLARARGRPRAVYRVLNCTCTKLHLYQTALVGNYVQLCATMRN